LYSRVAVPLANAGLAGEFYRSRQLVSIGQARKGLGAATIGRGRNKPRRTGRWSRAA